MFFEIKYCDAVDYFGVLDSPRADEAISGRFEIRGWICGVGSPVQISLASSSGDCKPRHEVRKDVYDHVRSLREKQSEPLYVFGFRFEVTDIADFELLVHGVGATRTWVRAKDRTKQLELALSEASKFFSTSNFLSKLRWNEKLGAFLEVDGQPLYYILGSVEFGDTNFVLLRDEAHSTHHILCQRVIAAELIHQVDLGRAVSPSPEFSHSNQEMRDRALELSRELKSNPWRSGELNLQQPIFGLGRLSIHHYFYETLPGLLQVSISMDQSVPRILATRQREYLETRSLLEGQWSEIAVEIPPRGSFDSKQSPILLAGEHLSQVNPEVAKMLDRKVVWTASSPGLPQGLISSPVIWFDLSVMNRKWNVQQVFADLMDEFLKMYENPTFVLDGLTAPWHELRDPTPEPSWISDINGINRAKLVSLDFARADEKIRWAFSADFYFASFTTGSMFLHRFASAPGVSMSAPRTTNSSRSHLNGSWRKIFIPEDLFVWQDLDVDPAWASFELKSHGFIPWAIGKALDFLPAPDRKQKK